VYSLQIEIATRDTDANRTKGHNRFKVHAVFKAIKSEIACLCKGREPKEPLAKFKLSFVRYGVRPLDYDNLISSLKPFIDGIKLAGIIEDDKWEYVKHIEVDQVKSKTEKKLVITVKEDVPTHVGRIGGRPEEGLLN
jgi:hypothetical protein